MIDIETQVITCTLSQIIIYDTVTTAMRSIVDLQFKPANKKYNIQDLFQNNPVGITDREK
jgi:hypothetical protein